MFNELEVAGLSVGADGQEVQQDGGPVARAPEAPRARERVRAPYEETIDSWLDDDRGIWREQRHTATRVYMRLRDEQGCTDGHPTMQRHVKRRREEMARECDRRDAEWFLTPR